MLGVVIIFALGLENSKDGTDLHHYFESSELTESSNIKILYSPHDIAN